MKNDDPNLTAFALSELPRDLHAEVARTCGSDPAFTAEAWEIRAIGSRLQQALAKESAPGLRPEQRGKVLAEAGRAAAIIAAERQWWRTWVPAAAAACAALVIGGSFFVESQQFPEWFFWSNSRGVNIDLADSTSGDQDDVSTTRTGLPAGPKRTVEATSRAVPGHEGLNLPPEPSSATARLTQLPNLTVPAASPSPSVDPDSIPMKGRLRIADRAERERVKARMGGAAAKPSPTAPRDTPELR